jgi:hypothetical protein
MALNRRWVEVPLLALAVAVAIVVSGCGSRSTDPGDEALLSGDTALIRELWSGFNAAWSDGRESGYAYITAHNHPDLHCTEADFAADRDQLLPSLVWKVTLDESSIEQDDGFRIRDADSRSFTPEGRIYRHDATSTYTGDFATETREWESHSAVLGDVALFFFACRD